ncbi:MAG: ABC transporter substrate-binding protein [Rhizobiales bacterium]|nr:ABC transporter substrate-binding protein [Hyphomicrobiales bacterium]
MSFWKSIAFAGALAVMPGEALAGKCPAEGFVISAGNAFLSAARAGSPQAFTSAANRYADLRSIALFALGPHRKSLPKGQEARYVSLAKAYMGRFMAKHASQFAGSGLKVVSCTGNTVNASTAGGKRLVFRVAGGKRGYRVMDVNASSIWLAGQMRSTFVGVINRNHGDINALIAYLQ